MDQKELNGRLLAVEALITELLLKMPPEAARAALNSALPGLQRVDATTTTHSTVLVQAISRRIQG